MYGLAVIEVISLSGHLSNIDEILETENRFLVRDLNFSLGIFEKIEIRICRQLLRMIWMVPNVQNH